jgi:hypothetical protein
VAAYFVGFQQSLAAPISQPLSERSGRCQREGCGGVTLAQLKFSIGKTVRGWRIKVTAKLETSARVIRITVREAGMSARNLAKNLRTEFQRKVAFSICCRERIQSNVIAFDLESRFPGARIQRKVRLIDRSGKRHAKGDHLADFLIVDQTGPKLVFESCVEYESKTSQQPLSPSSEPQFAEFDDRGTTRRIEVTYAPSFEACVKWDTGSVAYKRIQSLQSNLTNSYHGRS